MNESQLPLDFKSTQVKSFKDFVVGQNDGLVKSLKSFITSDESLFYLWGSGGAGKSHILQALINNLMLSQKKAVILMPIDLMERDNISLIDLFEFICIDEIENIASNSILEEALFTWINEVRQKGKSIVLAGEISTNDKSWILPDLKSRLQSGRTHEVLPLNRENAIKVFAKQAKQKGMELDEKTLKYLQKHTSSNLSFLSQLLHKLDQATLVQKKQVTIPLLKKILLENS